MRIDSLISRGNTGSPKQLGERLGLSERAAFKYLKFMKEELDAPIEYSKSSCSYKYTKNGEFNFKYEKL